MATVAPSISHCQQPASKVTQRPQGHVCCRGLVHIKSRSTTKEAKRGSARQGQRIRERSELRRPGQECGCADRVCGQWPNLTKEALFVSVGFF